jgi:hypothetical protein
MMGHWYLIIRVGDYDLGLDDVTHNGHVTQRGKNVGILLEEVAQGLQAEPYENDVLVGLLHVHSHVGEDGQA